MTEAELIKAIHKGVHKANETYMNWSGGYFLSECGGESFMVANIAQSIMKLKDPPSFLCLEQSTKQLIHSSDNLRGRQFSCTGGKQRVDLALFNRDYNLKFAIEAKCAPSWNENYYNDIRRLSILQLKLGKINPSTAMQAGIFVAFIHSYSDSGEEKALHNLETKMVDWQERFRDFELKKDSLYMYVDHSQEKYVKFQIGDTVHLGTSICAVVKQRS